MCVDYLNAYVSVYLAVFHQMEGIRLFQPEDYAVLLQQYNNDSNVTDDALTGCEAMDLSTAQKKLLVEYDLKKLLVGLVLCIYYQKRG